MLQKEESRMVLVASTPPQEFPSCKSALPVAWRRLVELLQSTNFGRAHFSVKSGQPDFNQPVLCQNSSVPETPVK
jgi:hypothetical protein